MGTDIDFFAEKRDPATGRWHFLPAPDGEGHVPGDVDEWPYRSRTGKNGYEYSGNHVFMRSWFTRLESSAVSSVMPRPRMKARCAGVPKLRWRCANEGVFQWMISRRKIMGP